MCNVYKWLLLQKINFSILYYRTLLYYYFSTVVYHKSLQTNTNSSLNAWLLRMGPTGCPETSVTNYQSTLCNIPEGQKPLQNPSLQNS
jgi:hypothetical protein